MIEAKKEKGPIPNVVPGDHGAYGVYVEDQEFPLEPLRLAAALRPYRHLIETRQELLRLGGRPSQGSGRVCADSGA